MTHHAFLESIINFLKSISLAIKLEKIEAETEMPGIYTKNGVITVDEEKLEYPGDLLHEAGHLAVKLPAERAKVTGKIELKPTDGDEIVASLWSYAALHHLGIDPKVVFHECGYQGHSDWFIQNYTSGNYIGLPLLVWMGMCETDGFPKMKNWLRAESKTSQHEPVNAKAK